MESMHLPVSSRCKSYADHDPECGGGVSQLHTLQEAQCQYGHALAEQMQQQDYWKVHQHSFNHQWLPDQAASQKKEQKPLQ